MTAKLPLHSARWRELRGVTADDVSALLEEMARAAAAGSDDAWRRSWTDLAQSLLDDGTVHDGAYAALPHLVEAAAELPPDRSADFWVDLGYVVTAEDRPPVPADLADGFAAALRLAERAAVRSLVAGVPAESAARLALSCAAFAGHPTAAALWSLAPGEPELRLVCPACDADSEIPEFFADPVRPPFTPPEPPEPAHAVTGGGPWAAVVPALEQQSPARTAGEGWEPFFRVARDVAAAGVPRATPGWAVLCLVACTVAVTGIPRPAGREQGRRLMRLAGNFRCWNCEQTWTIADGLADDPEGARPLSRDTPAWTDEEGPAAPPKPAPARRPGEAAARLRQQGDMLVDADGTPWARLAAFSGPGPGPGSGSGSIGGVEALTVVSRPGRPVLVAGGDDEGEVFLWDPADGRLVHGPWAGHPGRVSALAALSLPGDAVVVASGDDSGTVALWDAAQGRLLAARPEFGPPVRQPAGHRPDAVTALCVAALPDGRTLLVTATGRGAVRLRDPATGEAVGRLNPYGRVIRSMAAVPVAAGHTLIAASDGRGGVEVWDPAVDDPWDGGLAVQPDPRALDEAGHRVAAVAAVPAAARSLLATADDRGGVMLWDPATGLPAGDGLPPSTGTAGPPVMAAARLPDGRTVLTVGSRLGRSLRVWEPETGTLRHIALDAPLTCLAAAGSHLIVGHAHGALSVPLTGQ
ncbi:WD40 repeat domain-containing protein [Streptomyces sp. NPDC048481]|uniref:WD40 repeat domain-containing protein n=1 Tax=Streptomyces sp. NPDC048481 TaxID=3365557 RepID=UPI003715571E